MSCSSSSSSVLPVTEAQCIGKLAADCHSQLYAVCAQYCVLSSSMCSHQVLAGPFHLEQPLCDNNGSSSVVLLTAVSLHQITLRLQHNQLGHSSLAFSLYSYI